MSNTAINEILPKKLQTRIMRLAESRKEPVEKMVAEAVGQYVSAAEFRLKNYKKALRSPLLSKEEEKVFIDRLYTRYGDSMDK